MRDDYCVVLDFLPKGHAAWKRPEPIAQCIGEKYFALLEIVPREGIVLKNGDKVYIGDAERKEVERIKRRISEKELTTFARNELPFIVEKIVKENEARFVGFVNTAQPVSTRVHQLELLPGIGKKHMWDIIGERKKGPFKNFEDLKARVKLLPEPVGMFQKRILQEIENENERFRLFAIGPPRKEF
ncbi:MAG TPA: DUF655 domain-containing protein [archaeon]|nr:DUF655 domain-containing protein [archaeon]